MKTKKTEKIAKLPRAVLKLRQADPYYKQEVERYEHPLPSRAYLLQILTEKGAPMFPEELVALFSIQPYEADFFSRRINAMVREGEVMINRKGAICIADKLDLIKGRVHGHADGFGFVVPDDGSPDLFIGPKEMHKVLHRDRVMVREIGVDRRGRREGKIVEVLEHVNTRLVGRLFAERGVRFIRPEEKRIAQEILVSPEGGLDAEPGQVVSVELLTQPSKYGQAIGRIVEVLGNYADPGMEIEIALRKHDLPHVFSAEAEAQAGKTPQEVRKKDWKTPEGLKREDLRDMPLVTIDGETARDFDDAVYAERSGKGWRLVVAIADVSHYVRPKDALDQTGYERGNSVYFPRRVIPMLPEALSNGICSLNPAVERCCMVCDMQVDAKGEVRQYRFYPAVMLSKARYTYNEVWEILQDPKGPAAKKRKGLVADLQTLYDLFHVLLKARGKRGAIDFDTLETQMVFNEAGKIDRIVPVTRNDAHRLIEECMLAANVCAADFLGSHDHTALYRIHEGPTERKLENLRGFLNERGLSLGGGDEPHAKDYAGLMAQVKERPDAGLLQTMLLRSMQQAVYSPERAGHFGLAYEAYTHFTSPIRRYPDLLVHRSIKAVLCGTAYKPGKWEEIGAHCSQTERRADEATRDVQSWLKCYYMLDRIGEVFEGVVSAVTSFGLFVTLDGLFVEGLLHISELGTDYFQYNEASHTLRGERSGKTYGLTDRITIKVARVDLETSKIDFVLIEQRPEQQLEQADAGKRHPRRKAGPVPATPVAEVKTEEARPAKRARKPAASPAVEVKPAAKPATRKAGAEVAKTPAVATPGKPARKTATQAKPASTAVKSASPAAPVPAKGSKAKTASVQAPALMPKRPAQVAALFLPKPGQTLPEATPAPAKRPRKPAAKALEGAVPAATVADKPAGKSTGKAKPAAKPAKAAVAAKPKSTAQATPAPKAKAAASAPVASKTRSKPKS
ncbi:ribonuclease R [Chitinimonas viridis]|uniref:Ribonuclease R n=1 Tax=Chitinimonas viridis TaxID=664880 RepID=A0ABT8B3W6_9NEIS|nr:ribonuclease R [Chitinimonas viridis]MDN3576179.1 ribonuclease R [Chitinimonas viridis]